MLVDPTALRFGPGAHLRFLFMKKTNFDHYLEEQLKDRDFAARFERAGEAWEVSLQLAALRQQAGLSQGQLARKLKTSQRQIRHWESPAG